MSNNLICFGDVVKLSAKSAFHDGTDGADGSSSSSFLGFLEQKKELLLVVPPAKEELKDKFMEAEFVVAPVRGDKPPLPGTPLNYKQPFVLKTSDGSGYSLNNKTPNASEVVSLRECGIKGEMYVAVEKEGFGAETHVHDGDMNVELHVVDSNRIRKTYDNVPLKHFSKPKSDAPGGFVTCASKKGQVLSLKLVKVADKTETRKFVKDPVVRRASQLLADPKADETSEASVLESPSRAGSIVTAGPLVSENPAISAPSSPTAATSAAAATTPELKTVESPETTETPATLAVTTGVVVAEAATPAAAATPSTPEPKTAETPGTTKTPATPAVTTAVVVAEAATPATQTTTTASAPPSEAEHGEGLQSFFHGDISREKAEELLLTDRRRGSFLIRYSARRKSYCASFIEQLDADSGAVKFAHHLIFHLANGAYSAVEADKVTGETPVFPDLVSFVEEYQRKGVLVYPIPRTTALNREISMLATIELFTGGVTEISGGSVPVHDKLAVRATTAATNATAAAAAAATAATNATAAATTTTVETTTTAEQSELNTLSGLPPVPEEHLETACAGKCTVM